MIYLIVRRNRWKDYPEEMVFRDDLSARRYAEAHQKCIRVERNGTVVWRRVPAQILSGEFEERFGRYLEG